MKASSIYSFIVDGVSARLGVISTMRFFIIICSIISIRIENVPQN